LGDCSQRAIAKCKLQSANCKVPEQSARSASAAATLWRVRAHGVRVTFERRAQTGIPANRKVGALGALSAPRRACGWPHDTS
jgi:hypothetical protein